MESLPLLKLCLSSSNKNLEGSTNQLKIKNAKLIFF